MREREFQGENMVACIYERWRYYDQLIKTPLARCSDRRHKFGLRE